MSRADAMVAAGYPWHRGNHDATKRPPEGGLSVAPTIVANKAGSEFSNGHLAAACDFELHSPPPSRKQFYHFVSRLAGRPDRHAECNQHSSQSVTNGISPKSLHHLTLLPQPLIEQPASTGKDGAATDGKQALKRQPITS
jgi:hypothetical protein